jgi:pyruvate/2-oxoglutarate dehydrogenase complex dihydrolipoamide acyltransferase (E2) component
LFVIAVAKLIGNRVVQSNSIDIGIAVEAEDRIMVPVIRAADKTSLADLAAKYKELLDLARQRRISPDMQAGVVATVANFGTLEWNGAHQSHCRTRGCCSVSEWGKRFRRGMKRKKNLFPEPRLRSH